MSYFQDIESWDGLLYFKFRELGGPAVGDDGGEEGVAVFGVFLGENFAFGVGEVDEVVAGGGEPELEAGDAAVEHLIHPVVEELGALAGLGGDGDGVGVFGLELVEAIGVVLEGIDFIEDGDDAFFFRS